MWRWRWRLCELAGVAREQAVAGMRASQPDAGNLTVREYRVGGRAIRFIDAMAANDPDSTRILWERYVGSAATAGVLLHARPDRRLRTRSLCALLADLQAGPYYLTGDTAFAVRCLRQLGVPAERIIPAVAPTLTAVLAAVNTTVKPPVAGGGREVVDASAMEILFAVGNRKGFIG